MEEVKCSMRQKMQQIMSKLSLFWRYFFLLAAVVLVFLAAFTAATRQFTRVLQDTYLEQAQSSFEANAQLFVRDMFQTHSLPMVMEDAEHYVTVSNITVPLDPQYVFSLSELGDTFTYQCMLLGVPDEGFMYFKRNGICLTRNRIFTGLSECLNDYLIYSEDGRAALEQSFENRLPRNSVVLPADNITVGAVKKTCLTVLVQSTSKDVVYGFLYPVESVLEYFQLDSLPGDTYFRLYGEDNTTLFSYGEATGSPAEYIQLSSEMMALSSRATIGIPKSYFYGTIRDAQTTAQIIFMLSVVLGVVMCFVFSHLSVQPIRRMLRDHASDEKPGLPDNELLAIDSFLKSEKERNVVLRSMLLSSLLVRAFSGLSIPEGEYKRIAAAFPMFKQPLYAAIVRDRWPGGDMEESSAVITLLRHALPDRFLCEFINIQEAIVLFPAEQGLCEQLQGVLLGLNPGGEGEPRFVCGVSAPFFGVTEISASIRQAQSCIPESGEEILVLMEREGEDGQSAAVSYDMKEFQQALLCWNRQEALLQIDQMATFAGKNSKTPPQELFYSVLFLLRDTAQSSKLSFEDHEKMVYQPTSSPAANMRRLKGPVNDLFEQKAALQISDKQILCEQIVSYVRENYPDATLCMASVSKQFGVSERFVYNAVVDITGMNMSNYLARCRMERAAMLLRDTDENISSIADKCGYPVESTFYRNFKKYYHMTPAEYKSTR